MGFRYTICPGLPGYALTIMCVTPGPITPMLNLSGRVPVAGRLPLTRTSDEIRGAQLLNPGVKTPYRCPGRARAQY